MTFFGMRVPKWYPLAFMEIFGQNFWNFWNYFFGFEIFTFEQILSANDQPLMDKIESQFGKQGRNLIQWMLDWNRIILDEAGKQARIILDSNSLAKVDKLEINMPVPDSEVEKYWSERFA